MIGDYDHSDGHDEDDDAVHVDEDDGSDDEDEEDTRCRGERISGFPASLPPPSGHLSTQ